MPVQCDQKVLISKRLFKLKLTLLQEFLSAKSAQQMGFYEEDTSTVTYCAGGKSILLFGATKIIVLSSICP
jgi:hypothetical protein